MSPLSYGIIGVFDAPSALTDSVRSLHDIGIRAVEAYTPYPVRELDEVLHPGPRRALPVLIAAGAALGAACGYFVQYWDEVVSYPLNVGGRPYHSWPAFIVSAFEVMLLFAIAAGFFGLWAACRLPLLYHPVFNADGFERSSCDRFMLCVRAQDAAADPARIHEVFARHGAVEIVEVTG